jgi:protein-S-isoprenylcysteine O-methyltransferase Ste14
MRSSWSDGCEGDRPPRRNRLKKSSWFSRRWDLSASLCSPHSIIASHGRTPYAALAGDVLIAIGWLAIFIVFKENTFTSATIELAPDQKVISTGPYALVRHPMYAGALVMLVGIPIALGSWWGVLVIVAMIPVLIWRLFDEEKFLARNLPGYLEYQDRVRYRLIPLVW